MLRTQLLEVAMAPPVSERLPEPATAVAVPPQEFATPFGVATTMPEGSVSVTATPVSDCVLAAGLVNVSVKEVVPSSATFAEPNDTAIDGGASTTTLAEVEEPLPPSFEVPAPVVLF